MTANELTGPASYNVAAGTAISKYRRCKYSTANKLEHAGASDESVGVAATDMPALAADRPRGDVVAVQSLNFDGRMRFIASGAIAEGAALGPAAAGKVDDSGGLGWKCVSVDVTADGDIVVAAPITPKDRLSTVNTTDATVTTLDSIPTVDDTVIHVEATVVGVQTTDFSEVASYKLHGTFKNDGGTLTLVGSVTADHTGEDTAGWAATLDADSGNIRIRVTGAAATAVTWRGKIKTFVA